MKERASISTLISLMILAFVGLQANATQSVSINQKASDDHAGNYTLVIEGFDWGAAASKVILPIEEPLDEFRANDFQVYVERSSECVELPSEEANGALKVQYAYASDAKGKPAVNAKHLTLLLYTAPFETLNSPIKYFGGNPKCPGNHWLDFQLSINNTKTGQNWNKETKRILPLIDEFDLSGRFSFKDIHLSYASFTPKSTDSRRPLIIWLHGGGEGGNDPTIPLIANRAANYASAEIQAYFDGAYVLVPQTPTFWMDSGNQQMTTGGKNDIYNESLMALIKHYVQSNPNIDPDRIYIGGCSNGGYMTLKLMLLHPDYFAAGFPSALAYQAKHFSDDHTLRIKDLPIWFIHSQDDPVTKADETATPIYKKLIKAGAKKVHYSLFEHVTDITNQFGGEDFYYLGHFSWIYSHTNTVQFDYDGKPVKVDGQPLSLMGWLARQTKQKN